MTETLEQILNETPETEAAPPAETEAPPTDSAQAEADTSPEGAQTGEEPKAEAEEANAEAEVDAPPVSEDEAERVPVAALKDERTRRQAAEAELNALRTQEADTPRPDVFEDPDGAFAHLEQQFDAKLLTAKLDMSEQMAEEAHPDYDEKLDAFAEAVQSDPSLSQKLVAHPNPGEFAYRAGAQHLLLKDGGGIEGLVARAKAEGRAEAEAEFKGKSGVADKARSLLPETLANEPNVAGRTEPTFTGPTPLEDLVPNIETR